MLVEGQRTLLRIMRADAPSFVPSRAAAGAPVAAPGSVGTGVPSQNSRRRGRDRGKRKSNKKNNDCGDTTTKPNASTNTFASDDNDTPSRSSKPACADQATATQNARERRRMRRRQANAEKSFAANEKKKSPVTGQGRKQRKSKKAAERRGKEFQKSRVVKGEGSGIGSNSPLNDLGAHFPSLGGTIRNADDSGKDKAQGSHMWSQIAAATEEAEENRGGDDELLNEIKAKDLTRLSSGLSAQSSYLRKKMKSGYYTAWSDEEDGSNDASDAGGNDDIINGAVQSNAEEHDISGRMESGSNKATLAKSRGFNMPRMRERWWAALREKQEEDSQRRAEAAQIKVTTRADAPAADDCSSSSCSSVSSWESSSSSSDNCGQFSTDEGPNRNKNCAASMAQIEVAIDMSHYLNSLYPLHYAIVKDDIQAVTRLLTFPPTETKRDEHIDADIIANELKVQQADDKPVRLSSFSLVHLSTFLDMPHMLRLLLDSSIISPALAVDVKDANGVTPLMIACQNGFEASVRVLLGYGPRMAMREQRLGDSALHMCCRCDGTQPSMLRLLLSSSGRGSSQQRILCARNKEGKTAMHVACEGGRTSIIETFLTEAPAASTKALKVEDVDGRRPLLAAVASGSTEVVISLLMWRGNNMKLGQTKFSSGRKLHANHPATVAHGLQSCPLTEAVSTGNCDMVRLLLEFGGPSVSASAVAYDVKGALLVAITLPPTFDRCDIIDLLINAGADPYSNCDSSARAGSSSLTIVALNGDVEALNIMLDVSAQVLEAKREGMRNDPLIQKHYQVLESRERDAVELSMQETLLRSLYWGWMKIQNSSDGSDCLRCCLSLYNHGAKLSDSNFFRLQQSLVDDKLSANKEMIASSGEVSKHDICFEAHYRHPVYVDRVGKIDKSYWCKKLLQLDWFRDDVTDRSGASKLYCPSMKEALETDTVSFEAEAGGDGNDNDFAGDLCILSVGGEKLLAHSKVLSCKSEKIGAAIRFANLQDDESSEDRPTQLDIDAPLHLLKYFLQHCYSGSIMCGLPSEPHRLVETLLELALLADEYLCPSFTQEIELRLLSMSPDLARCYCVSCCNRTSPIRDSAERLCNDMAMINCLCRIQKRGSLIKAESAADIIAVGQDEGIASTGYEIRAFLPTSKHSECKSLRPFAAASFNASRSLLQEFGSHCHDEGLSLIMLEACLDAASTKSAKEVSSLLFTRTGVTGSAIDGMSNTKRRTE